MGFPLQLGVAVLLFVGSFEHFFPIVYGEGEENVIFFPSDKKSVQVALEHPLMYDGTLYSHLYVNRNGFMSFVPISEDKPSKSVGRAIIAPLWVEIADDSKGDIFYEQHNSSSFDTTFLTDRINQIFPGNNSTVTWFFGLGWVRVALKNESKLVSFRVWLVTDDQEKSYAVFLYDDIPPLQQYWLAGFAMDNNYNFTSVPVNRSSDLPSTSNVGVIGYWAYEIQNGFKGESVVNVLGFFYPFEHGNVLNISASDGNSPLLLLPGAFLYFGNFHNTLYINQNGYQSFLNPSNGSNPDPNAKADIIAPLWTKFNPELIYYQQVTDGSLLVRATAEINSMFPGVNFSASWLLISTWVRASYSNSTGVATFQTVLVSGDEISYLLINYGDISPTGQVWLSGYLSSGGIYKHTIGEPSPSNLSGSSNVGIPGRWAFRTDGAFMDTCATLQCTEDEVCVERTGIYGCNCAANNSRNNPDTFDAIETCSGSSGTVSLSRCQLFEAGYSAQNLHLNEEKCRGVMEGDRVVFHFDTDGQNCGTALMNNGTHFIYENNINAIMGVGDQTVISRDKWLNLHISCVYPIIQSISMLAAFQARKGVISKDLSTEGTYEIHMIPYRDPSFSTLYPTNDTLHVNDLLYVAVDVVGVNSTQIYTVLDRCWATPVSDMNYNIYWNLINDECPNLEDGTVQVLQNGVSTSSRFSFKMFTFKNVSPYVFLHCKVHLCLAESSQCAQSCSGDRRMRRSLDFHDTASISMSF